LKTTYLVWKNPSCDGINPDWLEITGRAFYALVNSPEGKKRHFIKLDSSSEDDGRIVLEATENEYRKWRKEQHRREYLRNVDPGYTQISYHALEAEDCCHGEELLADPESEFENSSTDGILLESLAAAVKTLPANEMRLVDMVYRDEKSLSEIGELLGITKQAVFKRLNKILTKLKNCIG